MMRITETVKQLIIINLIFFIGTWIVGQPAGLFLDMHFPLNPDFKFWQVFTYMFMHANIEHILFNMLGLWMFGSALEHFWGPKKFIFFYISCGLGAVALDIFINYLSFHSALQPFLDSGLTQNQVLNALATKNYSIFDGKIDQSMFDAIAAPYYAQMLGASGALYGVIIAFAFMFPNAELMLIFFPIPIKAKYFVPGLLAFDLFMGVRGQAVLGAGDGVAHFAHLGGALVGFIMMWYWNKNQFNNRRWN